MKLNRHAAVLLGCAALMSGVVAACGSDDDGGGGSSNSAGSQETGATKGAKAVNPNNISKAKGNVTYCTGKDTSGAQKAALAAFNAKFKPQGLSAKLLEFPESADEQRNQFIQRQEAKSGECDIFYSDVIWTAEFASQKWLLDMTPYVEKRKAEFIPATFKTVEYDGKSWGVPQATDAALLYYRTDQVKEPPATWQAVYKDAKAEDGIVYAGASYEGLTCVFLELAYAAGGKVLSTDGKKAEFDSPENVKALQFMVDGVKNGTAPKAVTTYMEEPTRRAFESGRATYERQWPYAYATGKKNKRAPKFAVAALPKWEGGQAANILGGHNLVISAYSKNPDGSLALIDYLTQPENDVRQASKYSLAPVLTKTYDNPAVKKALPFSDELKAGVEHGYARPVSPVYTQISQAIYKNVNEALSGKLAPAEAIKQGQADMEKALATF